MKYFSYNERNDSKAKRSWESLGINPAAGSIIFIIVYGVFGTLFFIFLIVGVLARISCLLVPILIYIPILFCVEVFGTIIGPSWFGKVVLKILTIIFFLVFKVMSMVCIFSARQQIKEEDDY